MSGPPEWAAGVRAQDAPLSILARALESGRLASAYLFEGPSGVGKQRAAIALATEAIGGEGPARARVAAGSHPDVRVFTPRDDGRRNIPVETLREQILPIAQFAPFEAEAAFLIFPEADVSFPEHPSESANALLKTLEEPKRGVHFILLSERPDRLLPTIRSRCQRLRFGRLPDDVLMDILVAEDVAESERGPALALADGRADRALAMADGAATKLFELALSLDDAMSSGGPGTLVRAAEGLVRSDTQLGSALDALVTFYRDIAAACLGVPDERLAFRHRADIVRERAAKTSAARAADRVELIAQAQIALERNGNPQVVLDALLYDARV